MPPDVPSWIITRAFPDVLRLVNDTITRLTQDGMPLKVIAVCPAAAIAVADTSDPPCVAAETAAFNCVRFTAAPPSVAVGTMTCPAVWARSSHDDAADE